MSSPYSTARVDSNNGHSTPTMGRVYWSSTRSLWTTFITVGAILGGYATFQWDALLLCIVTSFITLCVGYSVGIHRRLVHQSFQCHQWLENGLVYLGVLTGLGGPFALVGRHDLNDWAQQYPRCHDYFTRRRNLITDWVWQTHCDIQLQYPPHVRCEPRLTRNKFYQWLEQTWMLQQLPWALLFYHFGGWSWLFWGMYVRIAASMAYYWLTGYLASHKSSLFPGPISTELDDSYFGQPENGYLPPIQLAPRKTPQFQRRNVGWLSLLSFGETLQKNHQDFPQSAKFSIHPNQKDPGWWCIKALKSIGLAWKVYRHKQPKVALVQPSIPIVNKASDVLSSQRGRSEQVSVEKVASAVSSMTGLFP